MPWRAYLLNIIFWVGLVLALPVFSFGAEIDNLRTQIEEKNSEITALEKEIAEFSEEIEKISKEAGSLAREISSISSTVSKLSREVGVTQRKIEVAELGIEKLGLEISEKGNAISQFKKTIAELIRNINELESQSLVEVMFANASLSGFFSDIDHIQSVNEEVEVKLAELKLVKTNLEEEKTRQEELRGELSYLRGDLLARKSIEEDTKRQKDNLLSITKNKETEYQNLLDDRLAKKEALEAEILSIEEELRVAIDPSSLPKTGTAVLSWPLSNIFITQYFGNTPFATQNSQVYGGQGHNGVDFRAPLGTAVKTSAEGVVVATGNTDLQRGCYSYGKWALVKHPNNLSTLYAHLSLISVSAGQNVSRGQLVGYSGNTGYSTGPHLHFTVYASKGVRVVRLGNVKKVTNCGNMEIPIAPFNSYLNPLSYLPEI